MIPSDNLKKNFFLFTCPGHTHILTYLTAHYEVICLHNQMQLKFGYDLKLRMWDESGGYAFSTAFRVEILRKRREKKNGRMCSRQLSTTTSYETKNNNHYFLHIR